MAPVDKCSTCCKKVTEADSGIECETCFTWFHIGCVGIPIEFYKLLGKNKTLSFNCTRCVDKPAPKNVEQKMTTYFTDLDKKLNASISSLDKKITSSFNSFSVEMRSEQQSLRNFIESSIASIRSDFSNSIKKVRLETCNANLSKIEISTMAKLSSFDLENNKLQRIINRADIIITGMPEGIDNLIAPVLKICSYYKVAADVRDLNHCMYLQRRKSILCKFNNVHLRDDLMRAYIKSPKLKLSDVIVSDISSRVYLNDNLTPAGIRLQNLCRALKRGNKIVWFRILNRDVPLCRIKFPDGSEKLLNYEQCVDI